MKKSILTIALLASTFTFAKEEGGTGTFGGGFNALKASNLIPKISLQILNKITFEDWLTSEAFAHPEETTYRGIPKFAIVRTVRTVEHSAYIFNANVLFDTEKFWESPRYRPQVRYDFCDESVDWRWPLPYDMGAENEASFQKDFMTWLRCPLAQPTLVTVGTTKIFWDRLEISEIEARKRISAISFALKNQLDYRKPETVLTARRLEPFLNSFCLSLDAEEVLKTQIVNVLNAYAKRLSQRLSDAEKQEAVTFLSSLDEELRILANSTGIIKLTQNSEIYKARKSITDRIDH